MDTRFRLPPPRSKFHRFRADHRTRADSLKEYQDNFQTGGYKAVFPPSSLHTTVQIIRLGIVRIASVLTHIRSGHELPLTDQDRQCTVDSSTLVLYKTDKFE